MVFTSMTIEVKITPSVVTTGTLPRPAAFAARIAPTPAQNAAATTQSGSRTGGRTAAAVAGPEPIPSG